MKSLKLTYTLMLLMVVLGLRAQETPDVLTQVVAVGTEMAYSVDVDDASNIANYYWTLRNSEGTAVRELMGNKPSQVINYENVPTGKYVLSVYATSNPGNCASDAIEINVEVIAQPQVMIVSGDKAGFCSFSRKSENIEEFIFDVAIEGYFGGWTLRYTIFDPEGKAVVIGDGSQQSVHINDSKTDKVVISLGDKFVNNKAEEAFYTVIIDEVLLDGVGSTPEVVVDKKKVKIGILPAVNIGTISSKSTDN